MRKTHTSEENELSVNSNDSKKACAGKTEDEQEKMLYCANVGAYDSETMDRAGMVTSGDPVALPTLT